jgi:hypothetical protein
MNGRTRKPDETTAGVTQDSRLAEDRHIRSTAADDASRYSLLGLEISQASENAGIPVRLKVTSSSMSPMLGPGDVIYLEFFPPGRLKTGDIVVYLDGQVPVTHRLINAGPRLCLTKGDALLRFDPPVDPTKILGRVVAYENHGKLIRITGLRWQLINRIAGALSSLEGQAARWGDQLFRRDPKAHPAWLSALARMMCRLLQLVVGFLVKLTMR